MGIINNVIGRFEWCSGNFSKAPIDLGGHTMSEVSTNVMSKPGTEWFFTLIMNKTSHNLHSKKLHQVNVISYVNSKVGNADFVSGHHTTQVRS